MTAPVSARGSADRSLRWLARAGGANMAAAGVGALAGILLAMSITHGFPRAVAGTFFAVVSAFLILETLCSLGVTTGLMRTLPEHRAGPRPQDCARVVGIALRPVCAVSVAAALALFWAAPRLAGPLVGPESAGDCVRMLRVLAVFVPVAACNDAVLAATRGLHTMRPTIFVENLGRLCVQPLAVLAVALGHGGPGLLAAGWALPYLLALLVNGLWLRSLLGRLGAPARTDRDTAAAGGSGGGNEDDRGVEDVGGAGLRSRFWAYTGPRALATVVQSALKRSDVVLVAALATASQAAVYAAASRFVTFGLLGVLALQQAFSPLLSKLLSGGRVAEAGVVFRTATVWMMVLAWPVYLVCANFAGVLLGIFGGGYAQGSEVVVLLALAMLFATACGPVDSVLLMAGRSWSSLGNTTAALLLNVGLNLALIPAVGIVGAAVSWAAAIVVRNVLPLLQVRHREGLRPESGTAARVALSCGLLFGVLPFVAARVGGTAGGLAAVAAGAACYAFLLVGRVDLLGAMSPASVFARPSALAAGAVPVAGGLGHPNGFQGSTRSRSSKS